MSNQEFLMKVTADIKADNRRSASDDDLPTQMRILVDLALASGLKDAADWIMITFKDDR